MIIVLRSLSVSWQNSKNKAFPSPLSSSWFQTAAADTDTTEKDERNEAAGPGTTENHERNQAAPAGRTSDQRPRPADQSG